MKLYKVNASLDAHNKVQQIQHSLYTARSVVELEIHKETIDTLDDIVSEALDQNEEDPTIGGWIVYELVSLIEFLERP